MKIFYLLFVFIALITLGFQLETKKPDNNIAGSVCNTFDELELDSAISDGESYPGTIFFARKNDWAVDGYIKAESNNYVGSGKNIRLSNINMHLKLNQPVSRITFDFAELGGVNKIMINGNYYNFTDFPDLQNIVIDQVGFSVEATQAGNNWTGRLTVTGAIEKFAIGGQELWIDNICTHRFNVLLENRADNHLNNQINPDGSRPQYNGLRGNMTESGFFYTEKIEDGTPLTIEYLNQFDIYIWHIFGASTVAEEEVNVIENYVSQGGSVFIFSSTGFASQSGVPQALFNTFNTVHGTNIVSHPTNYFVFPTGVIYTPENILNEAAKKGVSGVYMSASYSVSGSDNSWSTIMETDAAATPPNRPVIILKSHHDGNIMIAGSASLLFFESINVGDIDNNLFVKNLLYLLVD